MATTTKKRSSLSNKMGRPKSEALSSFPDSLKNEIQEIQQGRSFLWPINILIELEDRGYNRQDLPGTDSIARYLREQRGFPCAKHSRREYSIHKEHSLLDLSKIFSFLAKGKWICKVAENNMIFLGGSRYYFSKETPGNHIEITCSKQKKMARFHDVNEHLLVYMPPNNLSLKALTGASSKELKTTYKQLFASKVFIL